MIDLRLGDCLEELKKLKDGSVDAVVTDLPYGTTQCSWDVIIPFISMWEGVRRVLKSGGGVCNDLQAAFYFRIDNEQYRVVSSGIDMGQGIAGRVFGCQ